ncbi:MAG: N-acetylglucosamine-6-phosphate deacetylase [Oscillospiraceae bacterium]|nr:N-acetylglucosamine-6-phosphate deacetylase [Oscillospiraceae bacterium]
MIIKNGKLFRGKAFQKADIRFEKTTIIETGVMDTPGDFDASGCYVIPGLVDIHTHGAAGEDFSDGRSEGLQSLADYYAAHGVTGYLATTMTLREETLTTAMHALRDFRRTGGAKCLGVHLEGPFLSYAKRGAQAAENLRKPDTALFHRLNEASGNQVRLVTVACEEEGALDFIRQVSKVCTVSLGHTTADYDTAMKGFAAGATHATHLYNGMPSLLHRAPGVIGAAFDSGASVELICDGLHIHPAVIRATYRLFGDRLNLISDSLRCAGMPDGSYELGGQLVEVRDRRAALSDGTLAGSSISLLDAVRNMTAYGLPLEAAVYAASTAPAEAAGLRHTGALEAGRAADLAVLDARLNLKAVFVDGERVV